MPGPESKGRFISKEHIEAWEKVQHLREVELPRALRFYGFFLQGVGCSEEVVEQKVGEFRDRFKIASRKDVQQFVDTTRSIFRGVLGLGANVGDDFVDSVFELMTSEPQSNLTNALQRQDALSIILRGRATERVKNLVLGNLRGGTWKENVDWRAGMKEYMAAFKARPDLFGVVEVPPCEGSVDIDGSSGDIFERK